MRDYKSKRRVETLKHEVELLLAHTKLSAEDNQQVQTLIASGKYFEARNLILFILNQIREKNQFAINQEKQELINKYLRSDHEYQQMTPEGQHYWDSILSKHLDLLITIITQGQFLLMDRDSEHYKKLKINCNETRDQLGYEILKDLMQFLETKMNVNSANLLHAPKFNPPHVVIEKGKKDLKNLK